MLQAFPPEIRFTVAILAAVLVLGTPPRVADAQNQEAPEGQEAPAPEAAPEGEEDSQPQPEVKSFSPAQVARGGWVTLSVTRGDEPITDESVRIYLDGQPGGTAQRMADGSFSWRVPGCEGVCRDDAACAGACTSNASDPKALSCRVPVALGSHALQVVIGQEARPVTAAEGASQITILSGAKGVPKITGIFPLPSYPDEEMYRLTIQGESFSPNACDNVIVLGGRQREICWGPEADCAARDQLRARETPPKPTLIRGQLVSTSEISLFNIPRDEYRATNVQVKIEGAGDSEKVDTRFSRVGRKAPVRLALLGVLVIAALLILTAGKKEKIAGNFYGLATRLFLDRETDTYSLSKLQFYIWTLVGVLGYVYLAVSTWLVQGKLDFVDVPEGLPGIVMISAATGVLAQWAQSARGPKGAGEVHPSFADLITSGGVVAPERVQFFVWTVLGALAYIALVFLRDPGTINDLPKVPDGFLQLMGISSAGYLGGKLARKPGPVIDNISGEVGSLTLTLYGRNLSADASFFIRPASTSPEEQAGAEATAPDGEEVEIKPEQLNGKPVVIEQDDPTGDKTLAKRLKVTVKDPVPAAWTTGKPRLTIVNPDGQRATWWFEPKKKATVTETETENDGGAAAPEPPADNG